MRLAAIYAVLDRSTHIRREHLDAGLTVWEYCERSAAYLFGDSSGDRDSERLLAGLRSSPNHQLRGRQIHKLFNGKKPRDDINRMIEALEKSGKVTVEHVPTGGKPATLIKLVEDASEQLS